MWVWVCWPVEVVFLLAAGVQCVRDAGVISCIPASVAGRRRIILGPRPRYASRPAPRNADDRLAAALRLSLLGDQAEAAELARSHRLVSGGSNRHLQPLIKPSLISRKVSSKLAWTSALDLL